MTTCRVAQAAPLPYFLRDTAAAAITIAITADTDPAKPHTSPSSCVAASEPRTPRAVCRLMATPDVFHVHRAAGLQPNHPLGGCARHRAWKRPRRAENYPRAGKSAGLIWLRCLPGNGRLILLAVI